MTQPNQPLAPGQMPQIPAPQPAPGHAPMAAPMPSPYGQPAANPAPVPGGHIPAPPMPQAGQMPHAPMTPMPNVAPAPGQLGMPAAQTHMQPGVFNAPSPEPFGDGGEVALPNISIQAFCERSETAGAIHEMSRDWRMKRTNLKIFMGGLPAALDYYHKESTPALILVESGMRGTELFAQLDQLASVCDEGTQLIMVGAANDIKLYRQLLEQRLHSVAIPSSQHDPNHLGTFCRSGKTIHGTCCCIFRR